MFFKPSPAISLLPIRWGIKGGVANLPGESTVARTESTPVEGVQVVAIPGGVARLFSRNRKLLPLWSGVCSAGLGSPVLLSVRLFILYARGLRSGFYKR